MTNPLLAKKIIGTVKATTTRWSDAAGASTLILGPPYHESWSGSGGLSFKHYFGGRVPFRVEGQSFTVDDGHYVLVNADQPYEFCTDRESPVLNFTWFVDPADVGSAWRAASSHEESLLDDPELSAPAPEFVVAVWPMPPAVKALRNTLVRSWQMGTLDGGEVGRALPVIVDAVVAEQVRARGDLRRLSARRRSTRLEIYARLQRAKAFVTNHLTEDLSLDVLASVAHMSKYHFSRCFRELHGASPYDYVLRRRMGAAAELIASSACSVSDAATAFGYDDLSSFSRAFRRVHGIPPSRWGRKKTLRPRYR